jgi:hypothetical protein
MVQVVFKPWEKIVIHEEIEYELRDLIKSRVLSSGAGAMAPPLIWTEGVVFTRQVMPPTEEIIKEQLQGIIHYSSVSWAIMRKYRSNLKSEGVTIPVVKVSENMILSAVAKELQKKRKKR